MCKRLCILTLLTFVVSLSLAGMADADPQGLAGWWKLDETSGTTAADSSGNGNHGTLEGDVLWTEGALGGAWEGDGTGDYIRIPHSDSLDLSETVTVAMWLYGGAGPDMLLCKGSGGGAWVASYSIRMDDAAAHARELNWRGRVGNTEDSLNSSTAIPQAEWTHAAVTFNVNASGNNQKIYINGVLDAESRSTNALSSNTDDLLIGADAYGTTRWHWQGRFDDVRIYSVALDAAQINSVMAGGGLEAASGANPTDGATDVYRQAQLGWTAGDYAVTHDVYMGTAFDDVNDASRDNPMGILVSEGQTETTYDPGRMALGQTYYWRVDEVNGAPDYTIYKGNVWSFTVEPVAYAVENVVATSNTTSTATQGPEKLVDGSGLSENDEHSNDPDMMWLGTPAEGQAPYVQFEFEKVCKLYEMLVWNYNMQFESILGYGIKDVTVEYSTDGVTWTLFGDAVLAQGTNQSDYAANTILSLEGIAAQYVRLTANSTWGDKGYYGLSEVRFTYVPTYAQLPEPEDGTTDVSLDTTLAWRPGRDAAAHDVYLSTDPDAMALSDTMSQISYAPDDLQLDAMYYWRIDEVNEAEAVTAWQGDTWSFSTQEYIVIDDFESYIDNPDAGDVIWEIWIDGWVEEGGDPDNGGSVVGNSSSPFAEQTIVHAGKQSMPLNFDNAGAASISEVDYAITPAQDWTVHGIKSLSLWFYGAAGNSGRLYVKINGTKVTYDGGAGDIAATLWQTWNIDLATVGANLGSVTQVSVGVEGAGTGVVYVDDIRLYGKTPEIASPTQPSDAALVSQYAFEGNFNDSVGGHNGTPDGDPQLVSDATRGQVVSLNGARSLVDIDYTPDLNTEAFTLTFWANPDLQSVEYGSPVTSRDGNPTRGYIIYLTSEQTWQYWVGTGNGWNSIGNAAADLGEWVHLAATYGDGEQMFFVNGRPAGQASVAFSPNTQRPFRIGAGATETTPNYFFWGMLDDVCFYNQALTPGEIGGLVGRDAPSYLPF